MDPKPRPNQEQYMRILHRMTPTERLMKAFELSDQSKQAFREGLRQRFPDMAEDKLHELFLQRLALCHNRNY